MKRQRYGHWKHYFPRFFWRCCEECKQLFKKEHGLIRTDHRFHLPEYLCKECTEKGAEFYDRYANE